jgi:5-methylcytosine-specific restriction endonuclease McrA
MKVCAKCKSEKPLSDYHKDSYKKDGLSSYCKPCRISASGQWSAANPEKRKHIRDQWAQENPEKLKESFKKYRESNNGKTRTATHNWMAKKRDGGTLSPGLVNRLYVLQRGKCVCCGLPLGDGYQVDHIIPVSMGGTNTDENIQLLRTTCNLHKHAKHPIDFMQEKGFLL